MKNSSKKIRVTSFVSAAAIAAAIAAPAAAADKLVLRYSQWLPVGHWSQGKLLHPWFKEVAKATEGRVVIQPTAKALGAPPRHNQLVVDGIADVGYIVHGYTPGVFPLSEMVELPFLTKSAEANSVAYWRIFKKVFEPAGMHKDSHAISLFLHVPGHIYNNKRAINTLDDLNGLKLRIPNSVTSDALKMLGAVPMAAPVTKLRDGLAKRVFDGTAFTAEALDAFKITKFIKYATSIPGGLYNLSFALTVNRDKWNKISAKDKATVMSMAGEKLGGTMIGRQWDDREKALPPRLKKIGVKFNTISGGELDTLKSKLAVFEKRWIEKANKAGIDGAATLKAFRAEVANYKRP